VTLIASTYWGGAPWSFREAPPAMVEPLVLRAADGRELSALYWTPKTKSRVAVIAMHPRVDFTRHYTFPALLEAGTACLGANTRNPNNDIDTVHEEIVLDVGACVAFLRERGVDKVVLLGNSGGGSLCAFYQAQALLPAGERIAHTPAGAPTMLPKVDMLPADGMIYLAAHPGQGRVLEECIDPSVSDESDALSCDATLDMYDPDNGFREPPAWSEYADDFVSRFRAAQRTRVERLDVRARELLEAGRSRREHQSERERLRRKHLDPVMVVYRTMANLHYADRRLDPSDRSYGSLLSDRPDLMNMKLLGFARVVTPRAWLSTWSGRSSNADMLRHVPQIPQPTLVVSAGADREIYPRSHVEPLVASLKASDRTHVTIAGAGHYFEPPFGERHSPHRDALMRILTEWIAERFGS
jgi:pimeloyl-ACP methyl ester carboxylesterase